MPKKKRRSGTAFAFTAPLSVEGCARELESCGLFEGQMKRQGNMYRFLPPEGRDEKSSADVYLLYQTGVHLRAHSAFSTNVQITFPATRQFVIGMDLYAVIASLMAVALVESVWSILVVNALIPLYWLGLQRARRGITRDLAGILEAD